MVRRSHCGAKTDTKSGIRTDAADKLVRGIKRKTRKHYSVEEKIRTDSDGIQSCEGDPYATAAFLRERQEITMTGSGSQPPPGNEPRLSVLTGADRPSRIG